MEFDHDLDARGLLCPLPVLKLAKAMRALPKDTVMRLVADDPAAVIDVPHYCNESGNTFLQVTDLDGAQAYFVRKA